MDTRRRSDSREPARPPMSDEPAAQLVEIGPVPQPSRRPLTPVVLGLALFAAGLLVGSSFVRLTPEQAAAVPTAAGAGPTGAATTAGPSSSPLATHATPRPTSSPRPTPLATPVPTDVPWAWTASPFDTADFGSPGGLWTAGGNFVVSMDNNGGDTAFRISPDGTTWRTNYSSRAIAAYLSAAVIKDRLWFVLRIAGLDGDRYTIGYPTWTEDGANVTWTTKGTAAGDTPAWVGSFGQINGTWVMSAGDSYEGGTSEVRVSDDAIHWTTVAPAGLENLAIYSMARLGTKLVAIGQEQLADTAPVALTTTDGYHWKSAAFPGTAAGTAVSRIACDASACVAVGAMLAESSERPAIWRTTDGLDWVRVAEDITDGRAEGGLWTLVSTTNGFVATGQPETDALVSLDGATWRSVQALTRLDAGGIQQLAVLDDVIFGLGSNPTGDFAQWVGDLGALPFS